jgi:tetratricopeptide (TPR) repeat protein
MPSTLPVPSKGAIRSLRNLALGTSCTLAFGAGLLTEDRRRRIHAAREVHDNAKKLKSSRNYHSSGAAVAKNVEAQIMSFREECLWQAGKSPIRATYQDITPGSSDAYEFAPSVYQKPAPSTPRVSKYELFPKLAWKPASTKHKAVKRYSKSKPTNPIPMGSVSMEPTSTEPTTQHSMSTAHKDTERVSQGHNRQYRLAFDVTKILGSGTDPANVDAAALRFFDAFEEGLHVDESGMVRQLLDATVQLSKACRALGRLEAAEKILDIVLRCGMIDQEVFLSFNPGAVIKRLISGSTNTVSGHVRIEEGSLKKACSIYLTQCTGNRAIMLETMRSLGERLCAETCRYGMYFLTEKVFGQMQTLSADVPLRSVGHLVIAAHRRGDHERAIECFQQFYVRTSPNEAEFRDVVNLVIESIFESRKFELSEKILYSVACMARKGGFQGSTTWVLKVLGHNWRTHRNIVRTRELFERLEPILDFTTNPQAVYGAIIQFCVEANEEPAARSYYERLRKSHAKTPADVRIYGHFALAKAMRQDWNGTKEVFRSMRQMNPDLKEYSASFVPIFKLFVKSHPINEAEEILRVFVHSHGILLMPYISNIMIGEYIKARELDSVSRWLDYMSSLKCQMDPTFFNTVLKKCHRHYRLTFEEVYQIYRSVVKLGPRTQRFINSETLSTLRHIAIAESGHNLAQTVERLQHLKLQGPIKRSSSGRGVREAMIAALAEGDLVKTLRIYEQAQSDQIFVSPSTVTIAVNASLDLNQPNFEATARLLKTSQRNGQDLSHALSALFIRQLSELSMCAAKSTISALEANGILVPTSAITHTMSILVRRHQHREAIDFWDWMSRRPGHPTSALDVTALNAFLQAYIGLRDSSGIKWTVGMLRTNDLHPDKRFRRTLALAQIELEKHITKPRFQESARKFYLCLHDAMDIVTAMRVDATEERRSVKPQALKLMEKAILAQQGGINTKTQRAAEKDIGLDRSRTWIDSDKESTFGFNVKRLVSVSA